MDMTLDFIWLIAIICAWILLLIGYLIPTIFAIRRNVVNKWSVVAINVCLGWTLVGWVLALALSLRTQTIPRIEKRPLFRDVQRYSAK